MFAGYPSKVMPSGLDLYALVALIWAQCLVPAPVPRHAERRHTKDMASALAPSGPLYGAPAPHPPFGRSRPAGRFRRLCMLPWPPLAVCPTRGLHVEGNPKGFYNMSDAEVVLVWVDQLFEAAVFHLTAFGLLQDNVGTAHACQRCVQAPRTISPALRAILLSHSSFGAHHAVVKPYIESPVVRMEEPLASGPAWRSPWPAHTTLPVHAAAITLWVGAGAAAVVLFRRRPQQQGRWVMAAFRMSPCCPSKCIMRHLR